MFTTHTINSTLHPIGNYHQVSWPGFLVYSLKKFNPLTICLQSFNMLNTSPYFFLDAIYLHETVSEENQCQVCRWNLSTNHWVYTFDNVFKRFKMMFFVQMLTNTQLQISYPVLSFHFQVSSGLLKIVYW